MKESCVPSRITYNNYTVIAIKIINKVMLIKTYNIISGEIFWFVGVEMSFDLHSNIIRVLAEDVKYPNKYFKDMFKDEYILPSNLKLLLDEASDKINKRKRG